LIDIDALGFYFIATTFAELELETICLRLRLLLGLI